MNRRTTVLIADDHPLFLDGIVTMLEISDDFEVIGQATDGELAIEMAYKSAPDVILMDVNMPVKNGILATREIVDKGMASKVVIMSAYDGEGQAEHAIRSGAVGFYAKGFSSDVLLATLRIVTSGRFVINGNIMSAAELCQAVAREEGDLYYAQRRVSSSISPREHEIIVHITRGHSNKEIAAALGISHQTVKNHITSILDKLRLNDRTQAAIFAIQNGWIRIEDTMAQSMPH